MEAVPVSEAPKKNQTLLIVAGVAAALCCCTIVLAVAGYIGYTTIQNTQTDIQPFEDATPEFGVPDDEEIPTEEFEIPSTDFGVGEAPVGGLGNDILRNDTWQYVAFAAMGQGCDQPLGEETQIEVLQEPQNGVWVEQWNVACASGESYAYEIEFILDDTGATFNIKSLQ